MNKTHWMVRLVQIAAVLFVLFGCLMVFIYTPFYSKLIVKSLNYFVPVEVDQLAAQSQKMGALSDDDSFEPGSDLWIARQAYLKLMEQAIQSDEPQDLTVIQARYKALQQLIEEENQKEDDQKDRPKVPLLNTQEVSASEAEVDNPAQRMKDLLEMNSAENKGLMTQYTEFLKTHEIEQPASEAEPIDDETYHDLAKMDLAKTNGQSVKQPTAEPYAIVVLGGGLTLDKNDKDIIVNDYTRLRLETTLDVERQHKLPIVLSGVEAPYMQAWLKNYDVDAKLLEDRSMNTCENSRFSSLLLQKKGGAPTVILITDQYHMPRTRRLFALNGIETIPVVAPMPTTLTTWRPSEKNYDHSRRANYELLATLRDVWFGSSDCREVP